MSISQQNSTHRQLRIAEFLTLFVLGLLTMWSVRPLLEEWGLFNAFNQQGLGFMKQFATSTPLRPLHLLPTALHWELGQGRSIGVALGTVVLLFSRYFIARWAVSPILSGTDRWIVATLAAVLLTWPGAWLGRFGPAQISAVYFLIAFGCAIRLHRRWSLGPAIGCVLSILFLLATYQALALLLVALPLFALIWNAPAAQADRGLLQAYRHEIAVAATIAFAFIAYGVYAVVVSQGGSGGYESTLAESSGRLLTVSGIAAHVGRAYATAFGGHAAVLPLLLAVAFHLFHGQNFPQGLRHPHLALLGVAGFVLSLPLFSLIYVNELHIGDIERVQFPVATAFAVGCFSLLAWRCRKTLTPATSMVQACIVVGAVLAASLVSAYHVKKYALVQKAVLSQTLAALGTQKPASILIQDASGTLGDVYTFLNPLLTDALAVTGHYIPAIICTPLGVDRLHPDAQRYPIGTTQRCEELPPQAAPVLVLTARIENGALTLRP